MIKILLAEDQKIIRDIIKFYLMDDPKFLIADEAVNGIEALDLMENNDYDMVITDIHMPMMDGLELVAHIKALYPHQKTLVISREDDILYLKKVLSMGVQGFVLKDSIKTDLVRAIKATMSGGVYYAGAMYAKVKTHISPPAFIPSFV